MIANTEFAALFKKYRLYSEIESLKEFGDLLAAEGLTYENTIFTRWQKGQRYPHNRDVVLKIIEMFAKRGGIRNIEEANLFLESVKLRDLNDAEQAAIKSYFSPQNISTLPEEPSTFIGREHILKEAAWELLKKRKVLFHGVPGTGKTATAIHIAHFLKEKFTDGIYWFRADIKPIEIIVDELLKIFQKNPTAYTKIEEKVEKLNEVLSIRPVLVVLDNMEQKHDQREVLASLNGSVLATSVHKFGRIPSVKEVHVSVFTVDEYMELAEKILGRPYVEVNRKEILKIGELLGHLPIISTIMLRQISTEPKGLDEYLRLIEKKAISFRSIEYDRKNLDHSFSLVLDKLPQEVLTLLSWVAVFMGSDVSMKALSAVSGYSEKVAQAYMSKLQSLSLIEASTKDRYRLHPALKYYLLTGDNIISKTEDVLAYFESQIALLKHDDQKITQYLSVEFENIDGLMHYFYDNKQYAQVIRCWEMTHNYLFTSGQWGYVKGIVKKIETSYLKSKNLAGLSYFYSEDLGKIFYFQNNSRAEVFAAKGLKIAKKINSEELISIAQQKLAVMESEAQDGNLLLAEQKLLDSTVVFYKHNMIYHYIFSNIYLGHVYRKLDRYNESIERFLLAINNSDKRLELSAIAKICLAMTYLNIGKYQKARSYFNEGLKEEKKLNNLISIGLAYAGLSKVYTKENKRKMAQIYRNNAKEILQKINFRQKANSIWSDLTEGILDCSS